MINRLGALVRKPLWLVFCHDLRGSVAIGPLTATYFRSLRAAREGLEKDPLAGWSNLFDRGTYDLARAQCSARLRVVFFERNFRGIPDLGT
jgi:hypothetical protein